MHNQDDAALSELITSLLEGAPSSSEVAKGIASVERGLERLRDEREVQRRLALDPMTKSKILQEARDQLIAIGFSMERLEVALDRLRATEESALKQEERAAREVLRREVEQERDALAEAFAQVYTTHANALSDLFAKVQVNNEKVAAFNKGTHGDKWLDPVETKVRGVPQHRFEHSLLTCVRLPALDLLQHTQAQHLWPRSNSVNGSSFAAAVVPQAWNEAEKRAGAEARRIGEEVTKMRELQKKRRNQEMGSY